MLSSRFGTIWLLNHPGQAGLLSNLAQHVPMTWIKISISFIKIDDTVLAVG
jgi:hypothetical protein